MARSSATMVWIGVAKLHQVNIISNYDKFMELFQNCSKYVFSADNIRINYFKGVYTPLE